MAWATHRPEDWQLGGKCDAWLWGGGRHGQLCETGRGSATPQLTPSFKAAQQVIFLIIYPSFIFFIYYVVSRLSDNFRAQWPSNKIIYL